MTTNFFLPILKEPSIDTIPVTPMVDRYTVILAIVKSVGLILAGIFGLIGATTNFRGEDKRLTYWGKWNLAALAFGLILSVTAQSVEFVKSDNDAKQASEKSRAAAEQSEKLLARSTDAAERIAEVAARTVRLSAQATNVAKNLNAVQANVARGLDPIEPLTVGYTLNFPFMDPGDPPVPASGEMNEYSRLYLNLHKLANGEMMSICPDCEHQKVAYQDDLSREIVTKKYAL